MNNEAETMKKKSKRRLTPRLRFPDFRDEPGWEEVPLEQVAERVTTKNLDGSITRVLTNSAEHGILDQRDYFDKDIANAGNIDRYYIVSFGDFVYNPRISTLAPVGPLSRNNIGKGVMSPLYTVFQFTDENTDFYQCYFKSASWHPYLRRVSNMGARHDRMSITTGDFMAMPIPTPPAKEQKKISECLGSLGGLIAVENRALEALNAYKKGLMQQLFPQLGQTQPRLRFPEFESDGDWEKVSLASICQIQRGKFSHRPRSDPKFFGGPYAFIQTGDVVRANGGAVTASQSLNELGLSVSKLFKPTIVLITIAANIGDTAILESEACFTDSVVGLIPKSDCVTPRFLESIVRLKKEHLNQIATTGAQKNINNEILGALTVLVPSIDEQSRIEYCLSSLDTRIAAQATKIDSLNQHKRGLMQQLFPSTEEQ